MVDHHDPYLKSLSGSLFYKYDLMLQIIFRFRFPLSATLVS